MADMKIYTHDSDITLEGIDDSERTPCEVWTRCMGYFRPVVNFNIGKKSEFAERKYFNQKTAIEKCQLKEQLVAE